MMLTKLWVVEQYLAPLQDVPLMFRKLLGCAFGHERIRRQDLEQYMEDCRVVRHREWFPADCSGNKVDSGSMNEFVLPEKRVQKQTLSPPMLFY